MKKHLLFLIFSISLIGFWLSSCDKTPTSDTVDPKTAAEKTAQAYTEMENLLSTSNNFESLNFSNVEKLYSEAVTADPTNATANFGAAFSHMLGTFGDTAIRNTIQRWDGVGINVPSSMVKFGIPTGSSDMVLPTELLGKNLVKIMQVATSDPPTITEMQNLLRDRLLPRINYAIARLAVVETHADFELRISGKMQGNAGKKDLYLDLTEVYIMDAMLQGMKASVEQFLVFKFQLSGYTTKAAVAALQQNNQDFFVLASDGMTRAQSVKGSLVAAVGKIRNGVTFLKNETDNQNDDIIKRGNGGLDDSDIDSTLVYLNKIESALTGTFTIDLNNADSDNNDYTIQISLNSFFNNLPQNPKQAWFPTYLVDSTSRGDLTIRWQAQDYASFNFPDPTFSGLFPGMTNETLKRIMHIDQVFSWRVNFSLYENNGNLNQATTVKLVINGTTYNPKPNNYNYGGWSRYFEFYITDNNGKPVQQIIVVHNGVEYPMQFSTPIPTVRLKQYDYIDADFTQAYQNITAQYSNNSILVNLYQSSYYVLERSVNNGAFTKIDSSYRYQYSDNAISGGTIYKYRAKKYQYYYNIYGFSAYRSNNYTNTVSITTP